MEKSDARLAGLLAKGDISAFEQVFKTYFKSLHAYAYTFLKNEQMAEEMVQQVFYKIWEQKERLDVQVSLKAYLYRSVHNNCINHLAREKTKASYMAHARLQTTAASSVNSAASKLLRGELETSLSNSLNELPEQCRTIFQMSRFEGLKYQQIAATLGISPKTVENQIGKALKLMRLKLSDFLPTVICLALLQNW